MLISMLIITLFCLGIIFLAVNDKDRELFLDMIIRTCFVIILWGTLGLLMDFETVQEKVGEKELVYVEGFGDDGYLKEEGNTVRFYTKRGDSKDYEKYPKKYVKVKEGDTAVVEEYKVKAENEAIQILYGSFIGRNTEYVITIPKGKN